MNIEELEKLARAAHDGVDWFTTPELEEGTPMFNEDARFIYAANPAAILEFIEQYKTMREALEGVIRVGDRKTVEFDAARNALEKIGEIDEPN